MFEQKIKLVRLITVMVQKPFSESQFSRHSVDDFLKPLWRGNPAKNPYKGLVKKIKPLNPISIDFPKEFGLVHATNDLGILIVSSNRLQKFEIRLDFRFGKEDIRARER